jgi:hypothetical protein
MRKYVAVAMTAAVMAVSHPAMAIELKTAPGVSGTLEIGPNFSACGTLVFPPGATFAGELSATAYVNGPGTQAGTVRGAIPIVATGTWQGCIPGTYSNATVGDGKFSLTAHSTQGDYTNVQQCVVNHGALTCV